MLQNGADRGDRQSSRWQIWLVVPVATLLVSMFEPLVGQVVISGSIIIALIGIAGNLYRDNQERQHQLSLERSRLDFSLAVSSPFAQRVYDKQTSFFDEYTVLTREAVKTIVRNGATTKALDQANKLFELRAQYSPWLSKAIDDRLRSMEQGLINIGAAAHTANSAGGDKKLRHEFVWKAHGGVMDFLSMSSGSEDESEKERENREQRSADAAMKYIREAVHSEKISLLRARVIDDALTNILSEGSKNETGE